MFYAKSPVQLRHWQCPTPHKQVRDTNVYSQRKKNGEEKATLVYDSFPPGMYDHGRVPLRGGESVGQEKLQVSEDNSSHFHGQNVNVDKGWHG